ncbi:MAG: glycosyltransferase [Candidatus Paceibacterota bacterium]
MRVLFCNKPDGAFGFITDGMINALNDVGVTTARWDGKRETWDSFSPDAYIGCSGHRQPIPYSPKCKKAIHVNPSGPIRVEPDINEKPDTINWVVAQDPTVVYGYGHESDREYWSYWDRNKLPWVPMATAGDATIFKSTNGTHDKCDIGYIGGRWPYKAKGIDTYLLPVLRDKAISHMVYGWGNWPADLPVRRIADKDVPAFLANCRIVPCISEPHTLEHGIDLPERAFKAALSGAVIVHDPAKGLDRYLPHVITASNPKVFHYEIKGLLKDHSWLPKIAQQQRDDVLEAHTYHHRMATLMSAMGFSDTASSLLSAVSRFK